MVTMETVDSVASALRVTIWEALQFRKTSHKAPVEAFSRADCSTHDFIIECEGICQVQVDKHRGLRSLVLLNSAFSEGFHLVLF